MTNTYLVTGAMGCIGAWTLHHLIQEGQHVVSFDISEDRHRLDLLLSAEEQAAITFVKGDLTDFDQVRGAMETYNVTHIIHLAALQVPFCRADPVMGSRVNVVGTVNIFEAAHQLGLKHIAFASSIAVYGAASEYPPGLVAHDAPHHPHTLYGVYKVANEGTARVYWQDYELSSIALRPYTVYGLGRDQGLTSDPTKAMLAAVKGESFEIGFAGNMQLQLASDVAKQFVDASRQSFEGAEVFSLGTSVVALTEVVDAIHAVRPEAEITLKDTILPFPEGFDDSALRAAMPTVYETPLKEGIAETMQAFEERIAAGML